MTTCPAALNLAGAHHRCDIDAPHPGLGHNNTEAQAVWTEDHLALKAAWNSAEEAGR